MFGRRIGRARALLLLALVFCAASAQAIDASNRFSSPRNPERKIRQSTELIVLHTTEAPERSSLNKLSERGECHFCVTESGGIYRIVDRDREAFHAGRSMWRGKEDVDKFSIGIECVGYHDKPMGIVQLRAIRDLVKELKSMYHLTDDKVVCHSHVAYGAPNKWQRKRHRGRKRCGMLFAMPSVRRVLDLKTRPAYDADVVAKRLVVGDEYLKKVLYGGIDTMRSVYPPPKPPAKPKPTPAKPLPPKASPGTSAAKGVAAAPKSIAELKSRGYVLRGEVSPTLTALKIAGAKWNSSETFYTIRDKVIPGSALDPAHIEKGMGVWMKK